MSSRAMKAGLVLLVLLLLAPSAGAWKDPLAEVDRARRAGDYKLEKQLLEPLIKGEEAENPVAHVYWAWLMEREANRDEATKHFREAMRLSDGHGWAYDTARRELPFVEAPTPVPVSRRGGGRVGYTGLYFEDGVVKHVIAGSPAELSHITVGDKIISVDGQPVKGLDDQELGKRIRGLEGLPVTFIIERGGKRYTCKVVRGTGVGWSKWGPEHVEPVAESKPALMGTGSTHH